MRKNGFKYSLYLILAAALLFLNSCIVSNLDNGFDPKSPGGFLFYLNANANSQKTCVFNTSVFDACTLGP